jgi:hypothetical protein
MEFTHQDLCDIRRIHDQHEMLGSVTVDEQIVHDSPMRIGIAEY